MKYRILVLALLMLCGLGVVQAQDGAAEYQLHEPKADEYLNHIAEILDSDAMSNSANSAWQFVNAVTTEWAIRFTQQHVSLKELVIVFNALAKTNNYWDSRDILGKQIVQTFIDEKILLFDPQKISTAHYEAFDIEATPRDFDGDGQPEWTLYVKNSVFTQRYVVAYQDKHYQLIDVPLPWFGCCYMYYSTQSGFTEEQLFADLTGDGLPEWVLAFGGIGANDTDFGRLYVFQWQNGKIIDVSSTRNEDKDMSYISPAGGGGASLFPYGVHIEYSQPKKDDTRNIITHHKEDDNWGCSWEDQQTFAWQGEAFGLNDTHRTYDDVQGCEIRRAEEAMWSFDFTEAIRHYEQGLKLPPTKEYFNSDPTEIIRYATARLAIAYKLAGREEDAIQTINGLSPLETDSPTLAKFLTAIKANIQNDDMYLCQAAFDVFNFKCPFDTDACLGSALKAIVGRTLENSGTSLSSPRTSFPAAERAGCDLGAPVKIQLDISPLGIDQTPPSQLEKMGYKVAHTVHFDLNNDGHDEWLVWLDMFVEPMFFSPSNSDPHYQFSYESIPYLFTHSYIFQADQNTNPYFDRDVQYKTAWLPDHSGKLLLTAQSRSYKGSIPSCPPEQVTNTGTSQPYIGAFVLWKLQAGKIIFLQDFLACNGTKFEDIFGSKDPTLPQQIKAWAYEQGSYNQVSPANYRWDENTNQYKLINIDLTSTDYAQRPSEGMWDADAALQNHEFAKALTIIEASLKSNDISEEIQFRMIYIHTLALEALNRQEEALAEYISIYKNTPESAWGKLAALHLECVANCGQS